MLLDIFKGLLKVPFSLYVDGVAGAQSTTSTTNVEIGAIIFDPSAFVENDQLTRTITLVAALECNTSGQTCTLELFNVTDSVTVVAINTTQRSAPTLVVSGALAVPANLPNSRKVYGLRLKRTGGTGSDPVTCKLARLELAYS